jgi:hypothetical protein
MVVAGIVLLSKVILFMRFSSVIPRAGANLQADVRARLPVE